MAAEHPGGSGPGFWPKHSPVASETQGLCNAKTRMCPTESSRPDTRWLNAGRNRGQSFPSLPAATGSHRTRGIVSTASEVAQRPWPSRRGLAPVLPGGRATSALLPGQDRATQGHWGLVPTPQADEEEAQKPRLRDKRSPPSSAVGPTAKALSGLAPGSVRWGGACHPLRDRDGPPQGTQARRGQRTLPQACHAPCASEPSTAGRKGLQNLRPEGASLHSRPLRALEFHAGGSLLGGP